MRGPNYKTADVRRTWRCSFCGCERKLMGDITALQCGCREGSWMQIVTERTSAPRPIQRPSDVERHPIDFGIEPPPPAPKKQEATIVKSAISQEPEPESEPQSSVQSESAALEERTPAPDQPNASKPTESESTEDDWGEGIF